jgi:hypothetical protein
MKQKSNNYYFNCDSIFCYLKLGLAPDEFFVRLNHDGDATTKVGHQLGPDGQHRRQRVHREVVLVEPLKAVALQ